MSNQCNIVSIELVLSILTSTSTLTLTSTLTVTHVNENGGIFIHHDPNHTYTLMDDEETESLRI